MVGARFCCRRPVFRRDSPLSPKPRKRRGIAAERGGLSALLIVCALAPTIAERSHAQSVDPWITRTSWRVTCEDPNTPFGPKKEGEVIKYGDGLDCAFDEAEAAAAAACPFGVDGFVRPTCHESEPNPEWVELREREIEAWQAQQAMVWEAFAALAAGSERWEERKREAQLERLKERKEEAQRRYESRMRIFCSDGFWNYSPQADATVKDARSEVRPEVLRSLSWDHRWRVRAAAGGNPRTEPSTLVGLADDCVEEVGESVVDNASTPFNVLVDLGRRELDDSERLQEMAARRTSQAYYRKRQQPRRRQQGAFERLLNGVATFVVKSLGMSDPSPQQSYGGTPRELDEVDRTERPWSLALSDSAEDRRRVALAEATPPEVLDSIATDRDLDVRTFVAANRRTAPATLNRIVLDDHPWVRRVLARNRNTPVNALERLAGDSDYLVRLDVARNPSTPPHLLLALAEDFESSVVEAVAGNPSTPMDLLETLAKDQDSRVRAAAARNLGR